MLPLQLKQRIMANCTGTETHGCEYDCMKRSIVMGQPIISSSKPCIKKISVILEYMQSVDDKTLIAYSHYCNGTTICDSSCLLNETVPDVKKRIELFRSGLKVYCRYARFYKLACASESSRLAVSCLINKSCCLKKTSQVTGYSEMSLKVAEAIMAKLRPALFLVK